MNLDGRHNKRKAEDALEPSTEKWRQPPQTSEPPSSSITVDPPDSSPFQILSAPSMSLSQLLEPVFGDVPTSNLQPDPLLDNGFDGTGNTPYGQSLYELVMSTDLGTFDPGLEFEDVPANNLRPDPLLNNGFDGTGNTLYGQSLSGLAMPTSHVGPLQPGINSRDVHANDVQHLVAPVHTVLPSPGSRPDALRPTLCSDRMGNSRASNRAPAVLVDAIRSTLNNRRMRQFSETYGQPNPDQQAMPQPSSNHAPGLLSAQQPIFQPIVTDGKYDFGSSRAEPLQPASMPRTTFAGGNQFHQPTRKFPTALSQLNSRPIMASPPEPAYVPGTTSAGGIQFHPRPQFAMTNSQNDSRLMMAPLLRLADLPGTTFACGNQSHQRTRQFPYSQNNSGSKMAPLPQSAYVPGTTYTDGTQFQPGHNIPPRRLQPNLSYQLEIQVESRHPGTSENLDHIPLGDKSSDSSAHMNNVALEDMKEHKSEPTSPFADENLDDELVEYIRVNYFNDQVCKLSGTDDIVRAITKSNPDCNPNHKSIEFVILTADWEPTGGKGMTDNAYCFQIKGVRSMLKSCSENAVPYIWINSVKKLAEEKGNLTPQGWYAAVKCGDHVMDKKVEGLKKKIDNIWNSASDAAKGIRKRERQIEVGTEMKAQLEQEARLEKAKSTKEKPLQARLHGTHITNEQMAAAFLEGINYEDDSDGLTRFDLRDFLVARDLNYGSSSWQTKTHLILEVEKFLREHNYLEPAKSTKKNPIQPRIHLTQVTNEDTAGSIPQRHQPRAGPLWAHPA